MDGGAMNLYGYRPHKWSVWIVLAACVLCPVIDVWHGRNTDSFLGTLELEGELSRLRFENDVKERLLLADKESLKVRWAIVAGDDYQRAQIESAERMDAMEYGR